MEEKVGQETKKRHQLLLKNRQSLLVDGVTNVESFDDEEIVLETSEGTMIIRGDDLNIKELNLDHSNLSVEGYVSLIQYTGQAPGRKSRGFLSRMFK